VGWIAVFVGAQVLAIAIKAAVRRPRPGTQVVMGSSYSFPSSHAMVSIAGLGMLAYVALLVWRPSQPWRYVIVAAAAALTVAVGASRVYLGVHYVSDVIGGYAAGATWAAICVAMTGVALHHSRG
jgi:undecaprenyl-diphosphatase